MGEPKAFASLSSGLLARKGSARPAMRPQGFGQMGSGLEDLGWNDMGFEPPKPSEEEKRDEDHDAFGADVESHPTRTCADGLTPVGSPVHEQQSDLQGKLAECTEQGEEVDETAEEYEPTEEEKAALAASAAADPSDRAGNVANQDSPDEDETASEEVAASEEVSETPYSKPMAIPVVASAKPAAAIVPPRRQPRGRRSPGSKELAAFTLRIDKERHLRLRLACAVKGLSAQKLLTEALDRLLDGMPELDGMADNADEKKNASN